MAWSLLANLVIGDTAYVVRNLALSAGLLVLAGRLGLDRAALGLAPGHWRAGLRWGAGAAGVVAVVLAAAVVLADTLPLVAALLGDQRAALAPQALAFAALVRIPLGTALFEELAFRGVLLAVLVRHLGAGRAAWVSSAVFGLWHIAPTIVALEENNVEVASIAGVAAVVGAVAVTSVAGLLFVWLRVRAASLLAPILAHTATNSIGLLAAAAVSGTLGSGGSSP